MSNVYIYYNQLQCDCNHKVDYFTKINNKVNYMQLLPTKMICEALASFGLKSVT